MCRVRQSKQKHAADAERAAEGRLLELRDAGSKLHSMNQALADYASQNKEAQLERVTQALETAKERQSKAESTLQVNSLRPVPRECLACDITAPTAANSSKHYRTDLNCCLTCDHKHTAPKCFLDIGTLQQSHFLTNSQHHLQEQMVGHLQHATVMTAGGSISSLIGCWDEMS